MPLCICAATFRRAIPARKKAPRSNQRYSSRFDAPRSGCYDRTAGWSSLVARWAHNPKVGGSNPPPATNAINILGLLLFLALSFIIGGDERP